MMLFRLVAGVVALMLTRSLAGAQSESAGNGAAEVLSNGSLMHTLAAAAVTGKPYSAVQTHRTRQTLADGTTISHQGHHLVARDSEGRVRVERRLENGQNGQPDTVMVFVLDPTAHTLTTWVSGGKANKVATLVKLPAEKRDARASAAQGRPVADSTRPQPVITTQDLGTDSLNGLPVTVVKTTTVVPAGRSGNDAPITKTHEVWTSPDLKLVMKEQWEDPRSGERTLELDEFSRSEPDAALFRAPNGYAVKDVMQSLKEMEEKLSAAQN